MQSPPPQLDPVAAATAIFAILFSPELAVYVGPYAVIILAGCAGAALSVQRRPVTSRYSTLKYFALMSVLAICATVPAAEVIGEWVNAKDHRAWFGPVALLIGGVGTDWPSLIKWLGARFMRIFEKRFGVDGEDK